MKRNWIFICLLVSAVSACARPKAHSDRLIVYGTEDSPLRIVFRGAEVAWGHITDDSISVPDVLFKEQGEPTAVLVDATADKCIAFGQMIIAIPKNLAVGVHYTCGGAKFVVAKCQSSSTDACEKALISANCHVMAGAGCKEPEAPTHFRGTAVGLPFLAVYDRSKGVVEIGIQPVDAPGNRLRLQGEVGVLRTD